MTIDLQTLVAEAADIKTDDCRQTYFELRLNGVDIDEARKQSFEHIADPQHGNSKFRGPLDHLQRRTLAIDMRSGKTNSIADDLHAVPLTMDTRTDEEREHDWRRAERINELLDQLNPRHREVLTLMYGFDGVRPMTYEQIAERMNTTRGAIAQVGYAARRRLRKMLEAQCT